MPQDTQLPVPHHLARTAGRGRAHRNVDWSVRAGALVGIVAAAAAGRRIIISTTDRRYSVTRCGKNRVRRTPPPPRMTFPVVGEISRAADALAAKSTCQFITIRSTNEIPSADVVGPRFREVRERTHGVNELVPSSLDSLGSSILIIPRFYISAFSGFGRAHAHALGLNPFSLSVPHHRGMRFQFSVQTIRTLDSIPPSDRAVPAIFLTSSLLRLFVEINFLSV